MTEQTEVTEINLSLGDLTLFANIIDLAVQRGAFKGAEAETVGAAFNRLVAVVKSTTTEEEGGEASEAADAE